MRKKAKRIRQEVGRAAFFLMLIIALLFLFDVVPSLLYEFGLVDYDSFFYTSNAAISLAFPASTIIYLRLVNPEKKSIAYRLGLSKKRLSLRNILFGVLVFTIILALEILISVISQVTNTQINTNVGLLFSGAPLWFFIFATFVTPLNEESLFRGLMVPRMGVVLGALLFAALHLGYNSTYGVDFFAALVFGLLSGYVYKRTGSLYPSIIAHMLVNAFSLVAAFAIIV